MSVESANWIGNKIAEYATQGDVAIVHEERVETETSTSVVEAHSQGLQTGLRLGYESALRFMKDLYLLKSYSDSERLELALRFFESRVQELGSE